MVRPEPPPGAGELSRHDGVALIGSRCLACGHVTFPAAECCSACMGEQLVLCGLPRSGVLYAFSKVYVGPKKWSKPYILGYVDLPNGVRVLGHIEGASSLIGQSVAVGVAVVGTGPNGESLADFVFGPA